MGTKGIAIGECGKGYDSAGRTAVDVRRIVIGRSYRMVNEYKIGSLMSGYVV